MAGFPECIGSTDGTYVPMECCHDWTNAKHSTGYKLTRPSYNYNVSCNHSKVVLHTNGGKHFLTISKIFLCSNKCTNLCNSLYIGHSASWNNKTNVLYDDLIRGVHEEHILSQFEFNLYEYDQEGNIVSIAHQGGVWFICDNSYFDWSITAPPFKLGVN